MEPIEKKINNTIFNLKKKKDQLIKKIQEELQLQISSDLIDEMIKDKTLRKFISYIEYNLSEFLKSRKLKANCKLFFQKEWEIPKILNIIFSINFKGLTFKEKMKHWDEIIELIEGKIDILIESNSGEMKEQLIELKWRFYLSLD
jgi:hypothetical protein